jgi:hypothetical protein
MVGLKVTVKNTIGLINVVFENSLIQRHWYYPHNIDLMHQEYNGVEIIISMCFNVTGFSKDNMNARKDLATLCNHPSLKVKRNVTENLTRPRAPLFEAGRKKRDI